MSLTETVSAAGLAAYAEIALILFFAAFVVVLAQVLRKASFQAFDHASTLPLEDDGDVHTRPTARATPEAIRHGR